MRNRWIHLLFHACSLVIFPCLIISQVSAQAPVISSFSPANGPVGTTVVISGSGFNPTAANNIVYFGAVKAAVSSATATSLSVKVPVGASYQPITVTTNSLTAYSSKFFIVTFLSVKRFTATSLAAKVDFATGGNPYSVSLGDLDGDGKTDMLVSNLDSNNISILRNTGNNGTISFAAKVDYSSGIAGRSSPKTIALGDLDGDGKLDLAVANGNSGSHSISVFRNTCTSGNISFAAKTVKNEFFPKRVYQNHKEAGKAISKIILTYNQKRPHASLDYLTPDQAHVKEGVLKKRWKHYPKPRKQKEETMKDKE